MNHFIKRACSPRNLGVALALLVVGGLTASAAVPAYKSWLQQGTNLYTTGTNVGIGTANPLSLLQLTAASGDAKLRFHQAGDTGYSLITGNSAVGLTFQTFPQGGLNVVERMRITSEGNVGIGTTNPGAKLQVTDTNGGLLRLHTAGNNNFAQLETNINNDLIFKTAGNSEKMRIIGEGATSGNVGIRTTNPARILQVGTNLTPSQGIIRVGHNTGVNSRLWDLGTGDAAIFGHNDNFGIKDVDMTTAALVIDRGTGNVGIGTTNPLSLLQLSAGSGDAKLRFHQAGDTGYSLISGNSAIGLTFQTFPSGGTNALERMRITNTGNVGIGTVNPARPLQVGTNAAPSNGIIRVGHNTGANSRLWDLGTGDAAIFGHNDNFGIRDVDMTTAALVIDRGTGNVGIGVTNPTTKLDVNGAIRAGSGSIIYACPVAPTIGPCGVIQASRCVGQLSLSATCQSFDGSCNPQAQPCSPVGRMVGL